MNENIACSSRSKFLSPCEKLSELKSVVDAVTASSSVVQPAPLDWVNATIAFASLGLEAGVGAFSASEVNATLYRPAEVPSASPHSPTTVAGISSRDKVALSINKAVVDSAPVVGIRDEGHREGDHRVTVDTEDRQAQAAADHDHEATILLSDSAPDVLEAEAEPKGKKPWTFARRVNRKLVIRFKGPSKPTARSVSMPLPNGSGALAVASSTPGAALPRAPFWSRMIPGGLGAAEILLLRRKIEAGHAHISELYSRAFTLVDGEVTCNLAEACPERFTRPVRVTSKCIKGHWFDCKHLHLHGSWPSWIDPKRCVAQVALQGDIRAPPYRAGEPDAWSRAWRINRELGLPLHAMCVAAAGEWHRRNTSPNIWASPEGSAAVIENSITESTTSRFLYF
jgi:hypothetical protein